MKTDAASIVDGTQFFERNCEESPEIIDGLLRERQLGAFAGPFGMGKSPVIADLTVHLTHGLPWCGRRVEKRPVIAIDCETAGPDYKKAICAIAARLGVGVPKVPDELDIYLERDDPREPNTEALLKAVGQAGDSPKFDLLIRALGRKPNAIVFIDPLELLFRCDTGKKKDVLDLYRKLRLLLADFPAAALLSTFNLRKMDRKNGRASLLQNPRNWLEEVCGTLDILNRCDVRLGIDRHGDGEIRVINGIVRGRDMHPILIRSAVNSQDELAGFEQASATDADLAVSLSGTQKAHWNKLPQKFKFDDVADRLVPRSSLSRIIRTTVSLGALIKKDDGAYQRA